MPQLRRYSPTKLSDGAKMAIFLRPVFSASSVQRISDMHSKFTLRPHICGSMVVIQSPTAEIRRGKKERKKKIENTGQKYNGCPITQRDHNDI